MKEQIYYFRVVYKDKTEEWHEVTLEKGLELLGEIITGKGDVSSAGLIKCSKS